MSNTCSVHVAPGNVARVVDALERRSGPWEIDGSKGELLRLAVGPENLLVAGAERERQNETQRQILLLGSHSPSICLLRVRAVEQDDAQPARRYGLQAPVGPVPTIATSNMQRSCGRLKSLMLVLRAPYCLSPRISGRALTTDTTL